MRLPIRQRQRRCGTNAAFGRQLVAREARIANFQYLHSPNGSGCSSRRAPAATVETLSSVLRAGLQSKEILSGFANFSVDAAGHSPADFARRIKADTERWAPMVQASGFTPLD